MVLLKLDSHATATQRKVPEYIKCTRARLHLLLCILARAPNQAREGTYTVQLGAEREARDLCSHWPRLQHYYVIYMNICESSQVYTGDSIRPKPV